MYYRVEVLKQGRWTKQRSFASLNEATDWINQRPNPDGVYVIEAAATEKFVVTADDQAPPNWRQLLLAIDGLTLDTASGSMSLIVEAGAPAMRAARAELASLYIEHSSSAGTGVASATTRSKRV